MKHSISVYYDGGCHLCSKEISIYKAKDINHLVSFIDISALDFELNSSEVSLEDIHKYFHVKTKDGQWLKGVDAFVKIWQTLNIFKPLQYAASIKLTKLLMNLGYISFTKIRPYLPRKKGCETGTCHF